MAFPVQSFQTLLQSSPKQCGHGLLLRCSMILVSVSVLVFFFPMTVITTMTLGAGTEGGNLEASTKAELWGTLCSDLVTMTYTACCIYISGPSSHQ